MTPRPRRSTFPEARALVALVALVAATGLLCPSVARAQACCVGTGLVTPARLRIYEDYGAGVQTRVRSVMGSFNTGGGYAAAPSGDDEVDFEEDLFFAARFGERVQAAVQAPFVQTGRRAAGLSEWGGGLGDVSANLRFDLLAVGSRPRWPGIALLAGLAAPTGRPVDQSSDPLATSATGTGSFEGNLGVSVEQVVGRAFASLTGFIAQRTSRTVGGLTQSFSPRLTALAAGGYALRNEIGLGAFVLGSLQGDARAAGVTQPRSGAALVTAGAAIATPIGETWRLQGTIFGDVPLAGWGRNNTTGAGLTISLLRVWL